MKFDKIIYHVKRQVEEIPGAFAFYKWITSKTGEGKIYTIKKGRLMGAKWRRYNNLPYWYHLGLYEPHIGDILSQHLKAGSVFWDVGAHAGYHALTAARMVGPEGKVIGIEPTPQICDIFREQLELNSLSNCEVIQAAVSDKNGTSSFLVDHTDSRISALNTGGEQTGTLLEVPTITLDTLAHQHPAPDVLKMDIEGAEVSVLPAAKRFLTSSHRPNLIIVAIHSAKAKEITKQVLTACGYRLQSSFDTDEIIGTAPAAA